MLIVYGIEQWFMGISERVLYDKNIKKKFQFKSQINLQLAYKR